MNTKLYTVNNLKAYINNNNLYNDTMIYTYVELWCKQTQYGCFYQPCWYI